MELDSREGTIIVWAESLMAFTHVIREARAGRDASCAQAGFIQRDYLAHMSASYSQSERHKALRRTLDERATLLGLQEMDLGLHEAILAKELERGLCHPDGCDLPAELDETHARVRGIVDDRATKAGQLSRQLI
jgi:hypothetical protein